MLRRFSDPAAFLRSAEGQGFVLQLERYLIPTVFAAAKRVGLGDNWLHRNDVVHTVLVNLSEQQGRAAKLIAEASHAPWAYLAKCAVEWVRTSWGHRAAPLEEVLVERSRADAREYFSARDNVGLTPLGDLVRLSYDVLAPHTPAHLRPSLLQLLRWLAVNPPQRLSYEGSERRAAALRFSAFTSEQIAAVMNVAWGGRPRRKETSLMAALLRNPEFRLSDSPTHARAILPYRRAMREQQALEQSHGRLAA